MRALARFNRETLLAACAAGLALCSMAQAAGSPLYAWQTKQTVQRMDAGLVRVDTPATVPATGGLEARGQGGVPTDPSWDPQCVTNPQFDPFCQPTDPNFDPICATTLPSWDPQCTTNPQYDPFCQPTNPDFDPLCGSTSPGWDPQCTTNPQYDPFCQPTNPEWDPQCRITQPTWDPLCTTNPMYDTFCTPTNPNYDPQCFPTNPSWDPLCATNPMYDPFCQPTNPDYDPLCYPTNPAWDGQCATNPMYDTFCYTNPMYDINCRDAGSQDLPGTFGLEQNHPNPFNPSTRIGFSLPETGHALLTVHDLTGRRVATLVDGMVGAGRTEVVFDATGLAGGVYVYTLQAPGRVESRKLVLLK